MKIKPGESITLTVIRDGKTKDIDVKLKNKKAHLHPLNHRANSHNKFCLTN